MEGVRRTTTRLGKSAGELISAKSRSVSLVRSSSRSCGVYSTKVDIRRLPDGYPRTKADHLRCNTGDRVRNAAIRVQVSPNIVIGAGRLRFALDPNRPEHRGAR